MTEQVTIQAADLEMVTFTANSLSKPDVETIEASELKYRTEVFITDLVAKANTFQDMAKRTDMYLYELLQDCYEAFVVISKEGSNIATKAQVVLDNYCSKQGIAKGKGTSLLGKFMNSVFKGADRSKISTYSYVIKYAVKHQVAKCQLVNEIVKVGGIQKIKEASFKDVAAKAKVKLESNLQEAQTKVSQTSMGVVDIPMALGAVSKLNTNDQVVLIASINAERKFVIRAATSDANVIKSALLAANKPPKAEEKALDDESTDTSEVTAEAAELEAA